MNCTACGSSTNIVRSEGPQQATCPLCGHTQAYADRTELNRLIGHVQGGGQAPAIPQDLPEIETAYDVVDENLGRSPHLRTLLAFDPIDALDDDYDIRAWRLLVALQKDLVEKMGVSVEYVVSSTADAKLDPIVDGVIRLSKRPSDPARVHLLTLEKLRGRSIRRSRYELIIRDGRFREGSRDMIDRMDAR